MPSNERSILLQLAALKNAIEELLPHAQQSLEDRFGTVDRFVQCYAYHNASHGRDVGEAAASLAERLVEAGRVRPETVPLARYAGWMHDQVQGKGHERLSALLAVADLRDLGVPSRHVETVRSMILATRVQGVDTETYRILQSADPDDPGQALLADADLSSLGMHKGPLLTLLLHLEQQGLNGKVLMPTPSDGMGVEPDRDATVRYLTFQVNLYDRHRYLLDASRSLFPHQESNRDWTAQMLERYQTDRITYSMMLSAARMRAAES